MASILPTQIRISIVDSKEPEASECEIETPSLSTPAFPSSNSEQCRDGFFSSITDTQTSSREETSDSNLQPVPRPIMARLPAEDETQPDINSSNGYLVPSKDMRIPGTLAFDHSRVGLTYTNAHLPSLNEFSRAAWVALHEFRPFSADYAANISLRLTDPSTGSTKPQRCVDLIRQTFDWAALRMPSNLTGTLHGVVFSSKRAAGSGTVSLYDADRAAHEEAVNAGGLLMYWYGVPNAEGENLATCIWTDQQSAKTASALPKHREAAKYARPSYSWFDLARYRVVKDLGEEHLKVVEW